MTRDPVMHFEDGPDKAACGVKLPTYGFFTDDHSSMEERRGSRCKRCWRVLVRRGDVEVSTETGEETTP